MEQWQIVLDQQRGHLVTPILGDLGTGPVTLWHVCKCLLHACKPI